MPSKCLKLQTQMEPKITKQESCSRLEKSKYLESPRKQKRISIPDRHKLNYNLDFSHPSNRESPLGTWTSAMLKCSSKIHPCKILQL